MRPSSLIPLPIAFLVLAACNDAPSAPQVALNPGQATTTQDLEVVFLSLATDGNKDEVTHRFTWFQDGTVRSDLTTDTVPASETTKGETWKVVVIASDGELDGPGAEAEAVIVNTPPVASVSLGAAPATDADLVAEVASTDDDADTVTYTYAWTRDGQPVTRADGTIPASETAHGETWTVTVTPNDGEEDGEAVTASVTVGNTAPTVESVEITPAPAYETSVLTATAFGVDDLDDDGVTLTYTWFVNDTEVQSGEDDTLTGALFSKHDLVRVEVTPTDGFVDGASVASDDALVDNTVPAGTSVSVVSSSADGMAYEASTLTCTPASWTDADGDAEGWTYTWQVDGSTASTGATLDGSLFGKGSVVACTATPNDGEADGAALTSSAVRVNNTAPALASATLSTTAPTESDVVSATLGAASDDDGDTITYAYAWNVDGVLASTSATLSPSRFSKGNRITLTVTPYDGTDLGASVTTSDAVAANTAPTVTSVSLTPSSVYTDTTITANAVSSDLDGDTVSLGYDWTVNGVPVGASGNTLAGSVYFDKGDSVSVSVTPNDGERDGTALVSSSVTVRNTLPTAPVVAINPAEPDVGDTLICDVTSPSTDADGDPLTYAYAWTENGSAFASAGTTYTTGDTVAGTWVGDSDTFVCSVTASDGVGTSGAGTDSVSIVVAPTCGDGSVTHTASGVDFVTVCAQTFEMGCTPGAAPCESDETLHTVTLTNDYYVGRTEVTQGEFRAVMGYNPSFFSTCGDDCPVETVNWYESAAYANAVSAAAGLASCYTCTGSGASVTCDTLGNPYTCAGYRLLTEAEWEAAARCGTDLTYAGSNTIGDVAWYAANAGSRTHAVAGKYPNACGLYDMSGNVWEWNGDGFGAYGGTVTDPIYTTSGADRVSRGAGWNREPRHARAANRDSEPPSGFGENTGFRLSRTAR